jgi:hypothetical protein
MDRGDAVVTDNAQLDVLGRSTNHDIRVRSIANRNVRIGEPDFIALCHSSRPALIQSH